MRRIPLIALLTAALPVIATPHAQTLNAVGVDTVQSGIGEESLAPAALPPQKPRFVTPTTAVSGTDTGAVAPDAAPANPFEVKGVVATISATGFDRDAALEVAARQALPGVLVSMGMPQDKATKTVKGLGNTMRFVTSYKVVKETLIPTYTLTTDLTFNGVVLQKNFGGKLPVAASASAATSATAVTDGAAAADVAAPAAAPLAAQWVVRITNTDPAAVDKIRQNLNSQAGTRATYRLLTSNGAELLVETSLSQGDLTRAAGGNVEVIALNAPLPTAPVTASETTAWQGTEEPAARGIPATPEGTY